MSERHTVDRLMRVLKPHLDLVRFEDKLQEGIADLWYQSALGSSGWLEVKFLDRSATRVGLRGIPWKSPAQPLFLNARMRRGGETARAGVLLHVDQDDCWYYWRAKPAVEWVAWSQTIDVWDDVTWRCEDGFDHLALLAQLEHPRIVRVR